jgi:NADPH:quinone reductase-like Zn-dependent oxidoreductase
MLQTHRENSRSTAIAGESTMQASIYDHYGPPEVVTLGERPTPTPRADQLLVRVHAAAVTSADWRFRAAAFPGGFALAGRLMLGLFRPRNPVLGMDFSGTVVSTGNAVTRFRPGDKVFGSTGATRRGAHAEYLVVEESAAIIHKPDSLSDQEAASIPFGGNAALAFMRDFGRVQPGQRVLIVGASGAVGVWAVQIARHLGAEVTGVSSAGNLELVRSLGAQHVRDYATGGVAEPGQRYDLIFDTIGVTTFAGCREALTDRGVYLPLNGSLRSMGQSLVTGFGRGQRVRHAISKNTRESLAQLLKLIESGACKPVVDRVYPLAEVAAAHRHVEGRHKRGTVVLRMA